MYAAPVTNIEDEVKPKLSIKLQQLFNAVGAHYKHDPLWLGMFNALIIYIQAPLAWRTKYANEFYYYLISLLTFKIIDGCRPQTRCNFFFNAKLFLVTSSGTAE